MFLRIPKLFLIYVTAGGNKPAAFGVTTVIDVNTKNKQSTQLIYSTKSQLFRLFFRVSLCQVVIFCQRVNTLDFNFFAVCCGIVYTHVYLICLLLGRFGQYLSCDITQKALKFYSITFCLQMEL